MILQGGKGFPERNLQSGRKVLLWVEMIGSPVTDFRGQEWKTWHPLLSG